MELHRQFDLLGDRQILLQMNIPTKPHLTTGEENA